MKRLAVALLAITAACRPNYQDGKTRCSADEACPGGFICGRQAAGPDVCYELSKTKCTSNQYLCGPDICKPNKAACPASGGTMPSRSTFLR